MPTGTRILLAIVVAIAGIAGKYAFDKLFGTHIGFPERVADVPRMHTQNAQDFEEEIRKEAERQQIALEGAIYGSGGTPSFYILAAADPPAGTADENFTGFVNGFVAGSGDAVTIDLAGRQTTAKDGATYICTTVGGAIPGSLCMWQDEHMAGFVETFGRVVKDTRAIAVEARGAVTS